MTKEPRTRHAQPRRERVTIDLGPGSVSRGTDAPAGEAETPIPSGGALEADAAEAVKPAGAEEARLADTGEAVPQAEPDAGEQPHLEGFRTEETAQADSLPPQSRRSQAPAALAAGIAGGVAALALGALLQYAGLLPGTASVPSMSTTPTAALEDQLTALEENVAALKAGGGDAAAGAVVGELTTRVDGLSAAVEQARSELNTVKEAVAQSGGGSEGLSGLADRIAALEEKSGAASGAGAPAAEIGAVEEKLSAVDTAVKAATTASSANDSRIAGIETSLAGVEQTVAALTRKLDAQAAQPRLALALAVAALKAKVKEGGTFVTELETFAAAAPDAPELPELREIAAKGIVGADALAEEAPQAAATMTDAARTVDADAGIVDRLLSSAESLVKVRPVGPVEGSGVPETAARLEAAVKDGDLARAIAEYETLPEGPKTAGAAFMDQVKERLQAEQLVDKATAGALKA